MEQQIIKFSINLNHRELCYLFCREVLDSVGILEFVALGAKVYDVKHNHGEDRKRLTEKIKTALKKMNIENYEKCLKNITTEAEKPIKNGY